MSNQDTFDGYFKEIGICCNALSTEIHKCHGLDEFYIMTIDVNAAGITVVFFFCFKVTIKGFGQFIDKPEARVMAGLLVLIAGITQADNEIDCFIHKNTKPQLR